MSSATEDDTVIRITIKHGKKIYGSSYVVTEETMKGIKNKDWEKIAQDIFSDHVVPTVKAFKEHLKND